MPAVLRDPPLARADEGLNIRAAARELGIHYQTLRNWIERGDIPITRFGRNIVRIHPDDLAAALNPRS